MSNGTYHLIGHANTLANITGLTVGTGPAIGARQIGTLTNNASFVDYVVSGDSPYWTGATDGAWDTTTTNWKLITAGTTTQYLENDTVLFDDNATGTTSVSIASTVNPASVAFNNSTQNYSLSGAAGMAGAGMVLTKSGTGSLAINNANSYGGGTILNAGTLALGNGGALGSGAVSLNGGTLDVGNYSVSNNIILGAGALSYASGATLSGNISETGGARSITAASTLTLSGTNSYSGGTTISGGTLTVGSNTALGTGTVALNGGTLNVGGYTLANNIVLGGGSLSFSGATLSGVISETGGAKSLTVGANLTLTGNNTYTGGTTINAGILQVGNGGSTGSLGSGAIVNNGSLVYSFSSAGTLSLPSGSNISGSGNLSATAGVIQFNGDITLGGSQSYTQTGGGTLFTGLELVGASTTLTGSSITLSGDVGKRNSDGNSLAVDTSASNGTINLNISFGRSGVWYIPASFTANAGTGTINVTGCGPASSGWRSTPVTLTGKMNITGNVSSGALVTINSNGTTDGTISGVLSGGMSLTKNGDGILTISNANNAFTGAVIVNGGTLVVSATTTGGYYGGTGYGYAASNTITVNSGATLQYTANRGTSYHCADVFINGGTITMAGSDNSLASGKTITFDTTVGTINGAGQLRRRDAGNKVAVTAAASGSTISIAELNLLDNNPVFDVADGSADADLTISSKITGGSGLVKSVGTGTLVLTGDNTYSGGTTINAGALHVGSDSALGSGAVTFNGGALSSTSSAARSLSNNFTLGGDVTLGHAINNGTLTLSGTVGLGGTTRIVTTDSDVTMSGVISNGGLTKAGAGTLILSGANTYTSDTTISAGTLQVDGSLASAVTWVGSGGELRGTGTVGGLWIQDGGAVAPGNSIESLTASEVIFDTNSLYQYELDTSDLNGALGGDLLVVLGNLTINTGAELRLSDWATIPNAAAAGKLNLIGYTGAWDGTFIYNGSEVVNGVQFTITLGSNSYYATVNYDETYANRGTNNPGGDDLTGITNFVTMSITAIPEPGTLGVLGVCFAVSFLKRRRL